MEVTVLMAFTAGIISFLSPCVLPLAPPYLAYLGGTTLDQISGEDKPVDRRVALRVFVAAVFFVAGLATVLTLLGMGASAVGRALLVNKDIFGFIAGGIIFGFGLHFYGLRSSLMVGAVTLAAMAVLHFAFGGSPDADFLWKVAWIGVVAAGLYALGQHWQTDRLPFLDYEARFEGPQQAGSYGASYVLGIAFAFGWTPCLGPILSAILSMAAQEETLAAGTLLLFVYALGLGVPFLIAAAFIGPFLIWMRRFRRHMGVVEKGMGVLLIVVGVAMVTGDFERFANFLLDAFPSLSRIG